MKHKVSSKKPKLTLEDGYCAQEGCEHRGIVHRTITGCYKCIYCISSAEIAIA